MKAQYQKVLCLFWFLLVGAAPAYANNSPQLDGVCGLILIFPVAILGFRLAGAQATDKERKWRLARGLLLVLCTILTLGGTDLALVPLLIILGYGILRGIQAIARGQGWKRIVLGCAIILFTLLAFGNYGASLNYTLRGPSVEAAALTNLRSLNTFEQEFQTNATLDINKNGLGEFGSLEQLHAAGLLDDLEWDRLHRPAYRYVAVLTGDPARDEKQYFAYAVPLHYGSTPLMPSLIRELRPTVVYARRTFAVDETGVVRAADLGGARDVTRAEAEKWPPI